MAELIRIAIKAEYEPIDPTDKYNHKIIGSKESTGVFMIRIILKLTYFLAIIIVTIEDVAIKAVA